MGTARAINSISTPALELAVLTRCEYAKPRKPAGKNTVHEMCDLAKERTQAPRVVKRTDFLDDLGDRVIRKIKLEISMKRKAQGHTKTETLTFRVSPRMKHLMDIMSRRQRRSLTAICECAIEQMASPEELRIAETTWSTDELERTLSLYRIAPHLCTYDEEVEAKKYTP